MKNVKYSSGRKYRDISFQQISNVKKINKKSVSVAVKKKNFFQKIKEYIKKIVKK